MSSGEKAKPPATFEERNPFDISRRSGPEVAGEIAKRMAAWKQARARTAPTPTTIPSGDAKPAPIAAPVQPARMPKATASQPAPTATPAARSAGSAAPRVPYFASASATRRAMPPAPSLKQGSTRPPAAVGDERAVHVDEPAVPIVAPVLEPEAPHRDESTAKPDVPLADTALTAATEETSLAAEAAPDAAPSEPSEPVASPPVVGTPISDEPDEDERRRAEAHAIKARWIAARDLDALLDTTAGSDAAPKADSVMPAIAAIEEDDSEEDTHEAVVDREGSLPGEWPDDEEAEPEHNSTHGIAADVEEPAPEVAAATPAIQTDAADEATGRSEPTFDAPRVRATPAAVLDRAIAQATPALGLAVLDEMAGRREPTFDAPATPAVPDVVAATHAATADAARDAGIAARDQTADEPDAQPAARAGEPAADEELSIAALDEVAGRKEPTFDQPVQRKASEIAPPVQVQRDAPSDASEFETRIEASAGPASDEPNERAASDGAPDDNRAAAESPQLSIAALDEAAGRMEPTFDEPAPPAKPAAAPKAAPRVAPRPIETRIEARRIDTLRADPQLSARRPIFPHIEPEEWDVPPVVAARRERRGTGWAIGLGSVLLIAGITAPAAIWQQGRQAQDQVALVTPVPAPQQARTSAPAAATEAQSSTQSSGQAPAQATLPAAPQPETPPPAPAKDSSAPTQAAPKPEADGVAANPKPATTLGTISDGGDVNEAPVIAPPPPTVNLASKPVSADTATPMVARPFVPEQGDGPFLRAPTTGTATVPVTGAPAQSAVVGVKPNLMVQLKPKAGTTVSAAKPVASKPRPVARKPKPFFQQTPEQMFNTLVETLSEGKPVNPATKPASPSTRR